MATAPTDCTPAAIYNALIANGFSTVQAIGAMANAIHESSLDPESRARDTNGAFSNGLWQFNEASFPTSGSLVTGNCRQDIANQIGFLKSHISGGALSGSTGAEVAGNFAANFEQCQTCSQGNQGANGWQARVNSAATVEGWIRNGNWPTTNVSSAGGGGGAQKTPVSSTALESGAGLAATTTPAGPGPSQAANSSRCLIGGNTFVPCLLYASQARAIIGGLTLALGGLLFLGGALVIVAVGAQRSGAAGAIPGPAGVAVRAAASGKGGGGGGRKPRKPESAAAVYGREQRRASRAESRSRPSAPRQPRQQPVARAA